MKHLRIPWISFCVVVSSILPCRLVEAELSYPVAPQIALQEFVMLAAPPEPVYQIQEEVGVPRSEGSHVMHNVRVTTYQANKHETDSDPFTTASGAKVADGQVAVSRDLLKRNGGPYTWGDRLKITAPGQHERCNRTYVVQDTMNSRFTKRVDIYLPKGLTYFSCYNVTIEKP